MTTTIKLRRDTAANWTSANPILAAGEPGLETDTLKVKYGDGTTTWANLEYSSVGNAVYATTAGSATTATTAVTAATAAAANTAGTVTTNAQPNITSVGTLTSLIVSGTASVGNLGTTGQIVSTVATGTAPFSVQSTTTVANLHVAAATTATTASTAETVTTNAQPNITSVGILNGVVSTGNISTTGYFVGDGGFLTNVAGGGSSYSNANVEAYLPTYDGNILGLHVTNTTNSTSSTTGALLVEGGIGAKGNIHAGGEFHSGGNIDCGGDTLFIGPFADSTGINGPVIIGFSAGDDYIQSVLKNSRGNGSADWTSIANEGDDTQGWTSLGMSGSTFNDPNYTITKPGDGYVLASGLLGSGGNLVFATGATGGTKDIVFGTGGFSSSDEFARIDHANSMFHLTRSGSAIKFEDGSVQDTAWSGSVDANNVTGLGNIATINLDGSASNVLYGNGVFAPVTGGSANLGNLEVTGTNIGIAVAATETALSMGNNFAGLSITPNNSNPIVKLYANTTTSDFFSESFDYTSGTYTAGGAGGIITLTGDTNVELFLNNLSGPATIVSVTVNGSDTVPYNGGSWGGGIVTIDTTTAPAVDPTNVTSITFNIVYENKFLLDQDDGSFGIYIGDNNFEIQSVRDVRIDAGDDFSVESNDLLELRNRSTAPGDGINLVTDYSNAGFNWLFDNTGNLILPATGGGLIKSVANASIGIVAVDDGTNNPAQLMSFNQTSNAPTTIISAYASNVTIQSNVTGAMNTWSFDDTGNLTLPGTLIGGTSNNDGYLQWVGNSSGDGAGYTTMNLVPDNTLIGGDQYLIIDPTAPSHIHIRAGGTQDSSSAQLFLGGENSHFSVGAGIDPTLYVKANNNQWTYGTDGNLTLPSGGVINYANGTQYGSATSVAEASFSIQTSNFNATAGSRYGVDTSGGAVTATLPASPTAGEAIFFADAGGAYASNNLTIARNGKTIMGASSDLTVSTNNQSVGLFYNGTTWRTYNAG